ncbi:MAG: tRNA threonylcarbamoyladenosine biosynthesis protein RimN [Piscirickettsiaceae bacterium]|nr:MAG: tRNA threonylcarbamoyladenosine biosynthesis protein RimN [Piscirickettsiaceae bacterium]PCI69941.1 MAG: tRNA threonylcarbamoyladenosine biosynthesis protein RimN [Piscirickettsiaceae bacterium]
MPSNWQKRRFVEHLYQGGVVAYPTEAVFGLGCDPLNAAAVGRLQTLKGRTQQKGFILIASNLTQLKPYIKPLNAAVKSAILNVDQEPTTWVLPANECVPEWLTADEKSIAVRLIQHGLAKSLCELAGMAIVSTSANVSGYAPFKTAYQTRLKFSPKGVYTINGRVGSAKKPSRIIDALLNKQLR